MLGKLAVTSLRSRGAALLTTAGLTGAMLTTGVVATPLVTPAAAAPVSAVTEYQPTLVPNRWGGRTHSVDVDPGDPNTAIAATESGGLFKTTNGGTSWRHIDTLLPFRMADARYAPGDRRIVIATVYNDAGRKTNGNGIFRSTDGGETWSKPATANPPCAARAAAWGIAFRPASQQVVVGTDCGFAVSNDRGATWTHVASDRIVGLAAAQDGNVYSCGNSGFRRSTLDAAATLTVGAASSLQDAGGTVLDNCFTTTGVATGTRTVGVSPIESNVVFVSAGPNRAYESDDNGTTWTSLAPATTGARSPYVAVNRANADPALITVYLGGGNNTTRQTCAGVAPTTRCTPGLFTAVTADHADQMAIAFTPETTGANRYCALFMADDGGTEKSADCGATFHIAGGSGTGGYNGLQVYEVAGQIHPDHTDLYIGTQDNSSWASGDNGTTWTTSVCCEGWHFQIPRYSAGHTDRITYETCGACVNVSSGPHLSGGATAWNNAPGFVSRPFLVEPGVYVQMGSVGATQQLYLSVDSGVTWTAVPGATTTLAIPNRGELIVAGPPGDPTVYVPVQRATGTGLVRILGARTAAATVANADVGLTDIDTGQCNGLARFVCPRSVGVDPHDPNHLLVADRGTDRVLQSVDGGNSWVVDTQLTALVTAGGVFDFDGALSAVAFDPNPVASGTILVGTDAAGIMASTDGGASWTKLAGSQVVTAVTSFFLDEVRGTIIVSSYGRGLWKLEIPQTDMRVSLSHRPDPATAGDELYWDITVTNDGPAQGESVTVTSDLPVQATYVTNTLPTPASCTATPASSSGQRVTCALGAMAAGESKTFTMKTAVRADAVSAAGAPLSIEHRVNVAAQGGTDPTPANNTAVDTVIVEDRADLEVTKLCTPETAPRAGEPVECSVFVDNHGPSDARAVVVDDTMLGSRPFTVTNVSPALASGTPGCTLAAVTGGQRLTCRLGTVAAATTTTPGRATITYRITSEEGQDINNTAVVRSDTPDPDASNDRASLALTIQSVADLMLDMAAPPSVIAGNPITWTMTATNNGGPSTARDVEITDTAPAGVAITSVTGSGGATCTAGVPGDSTRPSRCAFGSVAPGASRTMTVAATVLPSTTGVLHNDARVTTSTLDPDTGNDLVTRATNVDTEAALHVTHTDTPDPVVAGRRLDYVTRVTNAGGPSAARNVRLTDALPADVVFVSADVAGGAGTCTEVVGAPNEIRCELGTLQPGEYRVVTLRTTVRSSAAEGATLTSDVVATSTTPAPGGGASSVPASTSTTVDRISDVVTVKTSDSDTYKPSATIRYTVTVTNQGSSDAHPVTVVDNLPPPGDAPYVSDSGNGECTFNAGANTLTCAFGPMAAGTTKSVDVYVRVKGNKGTITNVATASTSTDDDTSNNTSVRKVLVKGGV